MPAVLSQAAAHPALASLHTLKPDKLAGAKWTPKDSQPIFSPFLILVLEVVSNFITGKA
jgi:hypothetical protein